MRDIYCKLDTLSNTYVYKQKEQTNALIVLFLEGS